MGGRGGIKGDTSAELVPGTLSAPSVGARSVLGLTLGASDFGQQRDLESVYFVMT